MAPPRKVGQKKKVHDVHDDAGYAITIDGTHQRLRDRPGAAATTARACPLTCDAGLPYDLQVTETPIELSSVDGAREPRR